VARVRGALVRWLGTCAAIQHRRSDLSRMAARTRRRALSAFFSIFSANVAWRHSASTLLPLVFEAWRDLRRRTAHRRMKGRAFLDNQRWLHFRKAFRAWTGLVRLLVANRQMVWARARAQDEDALFQERRAVASFFRTFALMKLRACAQWTAAARRGALVAQRLERRVEERCGGALRDAVDAWEERARRGRGGREVVAR
ncbi:hypothetical protein T484DRAFT_1802804, partial [Baffinella frigidus]